MHLEAPLNQRLHVPDILRRHRAARLDTTGSGRLGTASHRRIRPALARLELCDRSWHAVVPKWGLQHVRVK